VKGPHDHRDAVRQRARGHVDEPEPEVAVGLLVDPLEDEGVLEDNHAGGRFLDDRVPIGLEVAQHGGFPGARGAGQDVRGHGSSSGMA